MANEKWEAQVHHAIARRDVDILRRMAAAADREETRMWLTLLARMLELDARRRRRASMRPGRLAVLPSPRRIAMRRAV